MLINSLAGENFLEPDTFFFSKLDGLLLLDLNRSTALLAAGDAGICILAGVNLICCGLIWLWPADILSGD